MKTVAIIGYGHVGKAMHKVFPDAVLYDPSHGQSDKQIVNQCDLAIICTPTPSKEDGSCDTSIVEETVSWLKTPLILIKSTVPPGTTDLLKKKYKKRICMSPEYYGESNYWLPEEWSSVKGWPFIIIGGDKNDADEIAQLFVNVLGPKKTYALTDAKTAELTKYMENVWGAMKVTFANEFYQIAQTFGVSYIELRELWALDPRVEKLHTAVFDARGFGGKCFPKDLSALIQSTKKQGYEPEFLAAIEKSNRRFRKLNKKE